MLDLLQRCFHDQVHTVEWQAKLKEMIPSYGLALGKDRELCGRIRKHTSAVLGF
jgi:malate dehydrogenase (quinone)